MNTDFCPKKYKKKNNFGCEYTVGSVKKLQTDIDKLQIYVTLMLCRCIMLCDKFLN